MTGTHFFPIEQIIIPIDALAANRVVPGDVCVIPHRIELNYIPHMGLPVTRSRNLIAVYPNKIAQILKQFGISFTHRRLVQNCTVAGVCGVGNVAVYKFDSRLIILKIFNKIVMNIRNLLAVGPICTDLVDYFLYLGVKLGYFLLDNLPVGRNCQGVVFNCIVFHTVGIHYSYFKRQIRIFKMGYVKFS